MFPNRPVTVFCIFFLQLFFFSMCAQLVWGALKEVRRPQLSLVRDLISGVLHPVALAMPELIDAQASSGKVSGLVRVIYCCPY